MSIDWIDHVVLPVKSLDEVSAAYERLGLRLTPVTRHQGLGTENRAFFVGDGSNDFYVELLSVHDEAALASAAPARAAMYLPALKEGRGLVRLMLGTGDIAATLMGLGEHGIHAAIESVSREGGAKICDTAPLEGVPGIGLNAGLIQYVEARDASHARRAATGNFEHAFPLRRLDHLAAVAPDLTAARAVWTDMLGVPVFGEVRGLGIVITQLKIGDAILELLSPDGADSRLAGRPAGLSSMCAFEVDSLDDAATLARERGFHPGDPAKGILPGTRVTTIPGTELGGMALQLLEYV